ncbi:MAG: hypothetical protein HPY68_03610 [Candidatus Atribacteria bacterium]|nr:hypothetical protein [Candidatus Atribacteria bacterium]
MKKRKITSLWWVFALALVFLVSAMGCQTNAPSGTGSAVTKEGQAGTTLSASKTATGFWEKVITYDWTIKKEAALSGDGKSIIYTLTAERTKKSETEKIGVRGQITVTNGGERDTQGLSITDIVKYKVGSGKFQTLTTAPVDTKGTEILAGETKSFDYEVTFTPVPGAQYKNTAKVTILNHSGWLGKPFGPGAKEEQGPSATFSLPSTPTIKYVDQTADIEDKLECPEGFTCTIVDTGYPKWNNIGADNTDDSYTWEINYTMTPNQGNTICKSVDFNNTATLIEFNSKEERTAEAGLSWGCAIVGGCTYTQGHWRTHSKYDDPKKYDDTWALIGEDTTFFKSGQTYYQVLWTPPQGNVYYQLAHQYIAAKLNILNGASSTPEVDGIMGWAWNFFNTYTPTAFLDPVIAGQANYYASRLDEYNNGYIGPGHCSTE